VLRRIFGLKRNEKIGVGFEVPMEMVMKSNFFWDIMPCNSLKVNLCFGGTYHIPLQG
jgi:hypothetical protein